MGNSHNVAIIDDDVNFSNLLTEIITQAGYQAQSFTNPGIGLAALEAGSFDLAIVDQQLGGGMTGYEIIQKLRSTSKAPVIIISGYLDSIVTQNFINQGVSGVFFKPLNLFALIKRIEEVFQGCAVSSGIVVPPTSTAEIRGFTKTPFASPLGKELFLKKVQALSSFKGSLLLVGDNVSAFSAVAEELVKGALAEDCLTRFPPVHEIAAHFDTNGTTASMVNLMEGKKAITFFIRSVKDITGQIKTVLFKIAKHEPPFEKAPAVRFIFCLEEELDTLYENRVIDDEMYLFMGNLELRLPRGDNSNKKAIPAGHIVKEDGGLERILVIDDEELHAQMMVDVLSTAGYKALKLTSPIEALKILKKEKFSLILTDFRMPEINGVDFISQARALAPSVPFFIITGNIQLPEMVRVANMGITRLITKPIDPRSFLKEVDRVLKK